MLDVRSALLVTAAVRALNLIEPVAPVEPLCVHIGDESPEPQTAGSPTPRDARASTVCDRPESDDLARRMITCIWCVLSACPWSVRQTGDGPAVFEVDAALRAHRR